MNKLFKLVWVWVFVLGITPWLLAQQRAEGIAFFEGSWQQLLKAAKEEGRPFFVDFYTDWCGPCKMLEKTTFRDKSVGEFANKHYIAYRINAEKGEGIALADKYRVRAYPSIFFFDAEGNLIERVIGYQNADHFLYTMEKILKQIQARR